MDEIAKELEMMAAEDQKVIDNLDPSNTLLSNAKRLEEIVSLYGWPTVSKFGHKASHAAWLIAQHSDHDLEFQKKALDLMRQLPDREIDPKNIAYLEDRVLVAQNKPQLYGTQFYVNEAGQYGPRPIEDEGNIEERWKNSGLNSGMWKSFSEYKNFLIDRYNKR